MLSIKFYRALKNAGQPYHRIAWNCGMKPHQLYKITAGIDRPPRDDWRIKALCSYLNMPIEAAFTEE